MKSIYILIISIFLFSCAEKKDGFVQVSKLYNDFEMTKELSKKLEVSTQVKTQILDSLKFSIKQLEIQLNSDAKEELIRVYELKKQEYLYKEGMFTEESQRLSQTYSDQTMNQINEYVQEFGKSNGYEYIYGASGNGSLMYAKDANDITDQILVFINNKYQGK